jgi:hypothetical protein
VSSSLLALERELEVGDDYNENGFSLLLIKIRE